MAAECEGEGAETCGDEGRLCDAHHEEAFKEACAYYGWPYPPVRQPREQRLSREEVLDAYSDDPAKLAWARENYHE